MTRLDGRLCAVASMIRQGSILADIGSDHGYLACELVKNEICPRAYACDISEGPLARAGETIEKYGLSGRVEAFLSDGLCAFVNIPVDDIVIAGMGGELIARIIGASPWIYREDIRFILQPMSKAERLRRWLYANGFEIEHETAAVSGRFAYPVMRVGYKGDSREISDLFAWTGKIWDNTDEASKQYLRRVHRHVLQIAVARGDAALMELERKIGEGLM